MDGAAALNSTEELREALLAAGRERDALMLAHVHAQHLLAALESLLRVNARDDPFESVFAALYQVFTFSHSMMLADSGESHLECIVGHPATLVGSRWPIGPLFRKVLRGRVASTFSSVGIAEWRDAHDSACRPTSPRSTFPLPCANAAGSSFCSARPATKDSIATTSSSPAGSRCSPPTPSRRATPVKARSRRRNCAT